MLRDYRTMSPCERIRYYRQLLSELTLPLNLHDRLMREVYVRLIRENESLCRQQQAAGE